MKKDKLIKILLKKKGEENNSIDLDAYARGLIDMYDHLEKECVVWSTDEVLNIIKENEHIDDVRLFFNEHGG